MIVNAEKILAGSDVKKHPAADSFREAARVALSGRRVTGAGRAPDAGLAAAVARIKQVAAQAQAQFDLSPVAAVARGIKAPHKLLSDTGEPKTGGGVRIKKFRRCPYISYSGTGGIAMLQYAVPPDPAEPFWSGALVPVGSAQSKNNLDEPMEEEAAVQAFLTALAGIAPARA